MRETWKKKVISRASRREQCRLASNHTKISGGPKGALAPPPHVTQRENHAARAVLLHSLSFNIPARKFYPDFSLNYMGLNIKKILLESCSTLWTDSWIHVKTCTFWSSSIRSLLDHKCKWFWTLISDIHKQHVRIHKSGKEWGNSI